MKQLFVPFILLFSFILLSCGEVNELEKEPSLAEMLDGSWEATSVMLDGGLMPEWNDFELEINHTSDSSGDFIAKGIPHYDSVKYYFNHEEYASSDDYPKINEIWMPTSTWKLDGLNKFIRDNQIDVTLTFDQGQEILVLTFSLSGWPHCKPSADECPLAFIGTWRFSLHRTNE